MAYRVLSQDSSIITNINGYEFSNAERRTKNRTGNSESAWRRKPLSLALVALRRETTSTCTKLSLIHSSTSCKFDIHHDTNEVVSQTSTCNIIHNVETEKIITTHVMSLKQRTFQHVVNVLQVNYILSNCHNTTSRYCIPCGFSRAQGSTQFPAVPTVVSGDSQSGMPTVPFVPSMQHTNPLGQLVYLLPCVQR